MYKTPGQQLVVVKRSKEASKPSSEEAHLRNYTSEFKNNTPNSLSRISDFSERIVIKTTKKSIFPSFENYIADSENNKSKSEETILDYQNDKETLIRNSKTEYKIAANSSNNKIKGNFNLKVSNHSGVPSKIQLWSTSSDKKIIKMIQDPIKFSSKHHQQFSVQRLSRRAYRADTSSQIKKARYDIDSFNLPVLRTHSHTDHPPPRFHSDSAPTPSNPSPSFDPSTPTNITVQQGSNAFLSCKIIDLSNHSVSLF